MKMHRTKKLRARRAAAGCSILLLFVLCSCAEQQPDNVETYAFERMWPSLQQPWYFNGIDGIATDADGNVYVVDTDNYRIHKFTADGQFVTKWGTEGYDEGQFDEPHAVAVDAYGYVYVSDTRNNRIQKFSPDGSYVAEWGTQGSLRGMLSEPRGLALDAAGNVYVCDTGNGRLQKFSPDGEALAAWGSPGNGQAEFSDARYLAVDDNGTIYVSDAGNYRIQKFSSAGTFISRWGSAGTGDGQFGSCTLENPQDCSVADGPHGIALGPDGNVHVADPHNHRVQEFTPDGVFVRSWWNGGDATYDYPRGIAFAADGSAFVTDINNNSVVTFAAGGTTTGEWKSYGSNIGDFDGPSGIAVDTDGSVYVADLWNGRIQKFSDNGTWLLSWGDADNGSAGTLSTPSGVAVSNDGRVYVIDRTEDRVLQYTARGELLASWGESGSGAGQLSGAEGIAVDSAGYIYVADTGNQRIQKFTGAGLYVAQWGSRGRWSGKFEGPQDVAVDSRDNVYVADTGNQRIQKFTAAGTFLTEWGAEGDERGKFSNPAGIAVDASDNIYVADPWNYRVQKFTSGGVFIAAWGSLGSDPGQLSDPSAVAVSPDGRVYVTDRANNSVQVFTNDAAVQSKAIIVAGGGPYPGNNLWDATQMNASFAYRALTFQGFTKDSIYYLSADTDLDLDGDGSADDVDADTTLDNFESAVTVWATDAKDVLVYITDHGGEETFRLNPAEILQAGELDAWLDQLQNSIDGRVTVVYDACESGTFVPLLTAPAGTGRIVIASTSADEAAFFINQGVISFSFYFWGNIFNGSSLYNAFILAKDAMAAGSYQTALLDDNNNGIGNEKQDGTLARGYYLGSGIVTAGDMPAIGSVVPPVTLTGEQSAALWTDEITSAAAITKVWAVVQPPRDTSGSDTTVPVTSLPAVDLEKSSGGRYEAIYSDFTETGTYTITFYAKNSDGIISLPVETTVVQEG